MNRSVILLSIVLTGCAAHRASIPQAQSAAPKSIDPIIVKLVGRNTTLVARATQNGPTYSLESSTGDVIVPAQTLESLRTERPALAREVQTLEANAWAGM
jgi:hypothetical protein